MCGRLNLRTTPAQLMEIFALLRAPAYEPRYNIAPTQPVVTIRQTADGRVADFLRWGLVPSWAADLSIGNRLLNARSETAAEKPSFRAALKKRRCVIPADGFYEWQAVSSRIKQPWHIHAVDGRPLALAGLWETWTSPDRQVIETCTILTTTANSLLSDLHDRMPVILDHHDLSAWLDPAVQDSAAVIPLLRPCPDEWLIREAVNPIVNNARNETPECLTPA